MATNLKKKKEKNKTRYVEIYFLKNVTEKSIIIYIYK